MAKFGEQLPDALELVARTLRAGHAFTVGMKMVSDEFDDPMGTEFRRTLDEINFGVSVADALKSMAKRVDCPDLAFFVVSVIIQRDTGGNLAEIIDSMARIIRERFKLKGRIQVLSAEGKFSAIVLCSLPFLMALVISFINPKFMMILNDDPIGRVFVWIAIILMICGIFFMRRMIQIRV
jgi:tight adherence protein B